MTRKKWRVVYPGSSEVTWPTETATYDIVSDLRDRWAAGATLISTLTVQVDKGMGAGWQDSEHIDFAKEAS